MLCLALVIAVMLLPWPAFGENALTSSDTDFRQRKIIVQPKPTPEAAARDADQAVDELAARQRRDATVRELNRPAPLRPDLDQTVTGGIQTRNLNSARPR